MLVFQAWNFSIRVLECLTIYLGNNKFFKKKERKKGGVGFNHIFATKLYCKNVPIL